MRNLVDTRLTLNAITLTVYLGVYLCIGGILTSCAPAKTPINPAEDRKRKMSEVWQYKYSEGDAIHPGLWDKPGVMVPGRWDYTPVVTDQNGDKVPFDEADLSWHDVAMVELENRLITEINQLRRNPPAYGKKLDRFARFYQSKKVEIVGQLTIQTTEGVTPVREAREFVRHIEPLPPITRSPLLDRAALVHAADLHSQPKLSHLGSDGSQVIDRIVHHGVLHGAFAEMLAAGYNAPDLMVLQLLTDDGVVSRANRIHLLSPMFGAIGVACAPHDSYAYVCVIELAHRITPKKKNEDESGDSTTPDARDGANDDADAQSPELSRQSR